MRIKQAFPQVLPLVRGVGEDHVGRGGAKKSYGMKSPGKANSRIRTQNPRPRPHLTNSSSSSQLEDDSDLSPWATRCTVVLNFDPLRRNKPDTSYHYFCYYTDRICNSSLRLGCAWANGCWWSGVRTLIVPSTWRPTPLLQLSREY